MTGKVLTRGAPIRYQDRISAPILTKGRIGDGIMKQINGRSSFFFFFSPSQHILRHSSALSLVYASASWRRRSYVVDPTPSLSIRSSAPRERVFLQFTAKPLGVLAVPLFSFGGFISDSLVFLRSDSKQWQLRWSGCFWRWSSWILNNKYCYYEC